MKMDIKLCRTCGRSGQNFTNIFKTEGLKNKIETCLPIVVSQHCLLPDTLCPDCVMSIECFYVFTKSCLQNIIILEMKLDIQESCLRAKRRKDKSCFVHLPSSNESKFSQTEDYLNVLLGQSKDLELFHPEYPLTNNFLNAEKHCSKGLVDYDLQTDSSSSSEECNTKTAQPGSVVFGTKLQTINIIKNVVDNIINSKSHGCDYFHKLEVPEDFIREITERKNSQKRKSDSIESLSPKSNRKESGNKRKCSKPKKLDKSLLSHGEPNENGYEDEVFEVKKEVAYDGSEDQNYKDSSGNSNSSGEGEEQMGNILYTLPQFCLLCNIHLENPASLADHFMKIHIKETGLPNLECGELGIQKKKRNIPSLLKISDLKRGEYFEDTTVSDPRIEDEAVTHTYQNKNSCPNCPAVFPSKPELFIHLQLNHSEISTYLCGLCLKQTNSVVNLRDHVMDCLKNRPITSRYFCEVCCFGDDNYRSMERHVLVHNFLWKNCQKEVKNFDPEDYIQKNPNFVSTYASPIKNFSCLECSRSDFDTFKKFSTHRRNEHSIFHCDLCNKYYGRLSHLWKHVNRVHKNHPSISCQVCFKTSASKYHLAQHFAKTHQTKAAIKQADSLENFGRDAEEGQRTVTLRKQESTDQEIVNTSFDENSLINQSSQSEYDNSTDLNIAPKEIDSTHDLYANILTNYSPRKTEGDYKCVKCSKGFHKRMLLRKHKKNCRPKLQKDLLTRCKTCARVFKDRQSLAKHLINYHSDYECELCNDRVPSKCEIISHIRFQHPSSHLICTVCDNILRCKKDLLEHLVDHENSFVCQFCGDSLASKVKLKMHILSLHRKILSLSCGICLKLFETQQVLRNHVTLIHKGQLVPLMSCPVCGKNYGSKWKTFDHVKKSHGRFFKACKTCLEICETEDQLIEHIGNVHQNQQALSNNSTKAIPETATSASGLNEDMALNNSGNDFDTDSEGNTEETEDSPSSESEDEENSGHHIAENQGHHSEENAAAFPTQENKISLLEKRLLGKALSQTDSTLEKNVHSNLYKFSLVHNATNNKLTGEAITEVSVYPTMRKDEENNFLGRKAEGNNSHHSKRTVYENSNDPSFCEICHKTWPAKKHLWQHYIRCHKSAAATVCGICLKTNNSYESLQIHLRETHPTLLHGQGYGSNFICRICGRYHNASSKLRLHMAIHEKFDWALLEKFPAITKPNVKTMSKENGIQQNGDRYTVNEKDKKYDPIKVEANMDILMDNEEMFDDMIEQVEESTSSIETGNKTQDSSTDTGNTNSGYVHTDINKREESDVSENKLSFSNLLQTLKHHNRFQMLNQAQQNSIIEKPTDVNVRAQSVIRISQGSNISLVGDVSGSSVTEKQPSYLSEESSSSVSDCEHESGGNSRNQLHQLDSSDENDDNATHIEGQYSRNIFRPKPEELDSAIKSISDHCDEPLIKTEYGDFSESVQQGNYLNDTEIESAVGSIL